MSNTPTRHGLQSLARSVGKITKAAFGRQGFAEARVCTDWPAIVGADLAADSLPESLSADGALKVRVSGGRALELQHLEPQLLERIATYFGYRAATRLIIVQGPLPPRKVSRAAPRRALSPDEEAEIGTTVGATPDPGLRTALTRLGRAVLSRDRAEREAGRNGD